MPAQRQSAKPNAETLSTAEERQRASSTTSKDLARRIGELNRNAETNNLARPDELTSQKNAQAALDKLSREAMPQAANKIGSAQAQA